MLMKKKLSEMTLEELWRLFPIFLVDHKSSWKENYKEMENKLRFALVNTHIIRISHIGSTAIPLIKAKDIVDILLEVEASENLETVSKIIVNMGFIKMSSSKTRCSFNYGYTERGFADKVYHLHLRYQGDHDELYFRDYLNDYPEIAKEYEQLKLELWKKYEFNRDAYTKQKTEFITKYTNKAKLEYRSRYE